MSEFTGTGRTTVTDPFELVPVEDYRSWVVKALPRPRHVEVAVADALGLVLADDVVAAAALPAFTNSAMDGYAVQAADLAAASGDEPVTLRKAGEVHAGPVATGSEPAGDEQGGDEQAGDGHNRVTSGTAVAVMTGAPLPDGADAVVPVELTSAGSGGQLRFHVAPEPGANVRRAGEEIAAGDRLLQGGHRVTPADIGVLLATGTTEVSVIARPRVAVITTGDELVAADGPLATGQIRDSNGPMLAAMLSELGCEVVRSGPVPDQLADLTAALEAHVDDVDVIILSGGVSAGVRDHVADAIETLGDVERTKLAMQPGMPQALGRVGRVAVVALPGNPVSSFVSFEVLVRPALRMLQGRNDLLRPQVTGVLDEDVTSPEGKRSYLRVRLRRDQGRWHARLAGGQGSHMIGALSRADALAEVPEDVTAMAAGDQVRLHLLVS